MGGTVIETESEKLIRRGREAGREEGREAGRAEGREEGRILTVKIFQEAQRNPQATSEQIAEKVGCKAQEVTDTLKMFGI